MSLLKRIISAVIAAVLLSTPALAQNKKVVLSQAFQSMLYLPLYVAINEGFFTQQGVDLTKETAGAPSVALSAVISGSAQFSIHGPEWTAIAASKGAPVNIIANVVNGAAVWIATTPDFKFDSIKDVKRLPLNLLDALRNLDRSDVLRGALGGSFVSSYVALKKSEWADYARQLTDWERQTTLDC